MLSDVPCLEHSTGSSGFSEEEGRSVEASRHSTVASWAWREPVHPSSSTESKVSARTHPWELKHRAHFITHEAAMVLLCLFGRHSFHILCVPNNLKNFTDKNFLNCPKNLKTGYYYPNLQTKTLRHRKLGCVAWGHPLYLYWIQRTGWHVKGFQSRWSGCRHDALLLFPKRKSSVWHYQPFIPATTSTMWKWLGSVEAINSTSRRRWIRSWKGQQEAGF